MIVVLSRIMIRLLFLMLSQSEAATEACDLKLMVKNTDGHPMSGVVGRVIYEGKVIAEGKSYDGHLDFCDVGYEEISVVVGDEFCGQVTISHVFIPEIRRPLHVFYQNCHAQFIWTDCHVLIRVRDERGRPVEGATALLQPGGRKAKTDQYGRLKTVLNWNSRNEISITKDDLAGSLPIPCTRSMETFTEQTVVLRTK